MNVLAICSALNNSYVAFKYNDKVFSEIIKSDENYHSLYLVQNIKNALSEKKMELNNFDIFAVNCGPGSFTGIRVALTVAKVMAGELKKPLIPLSSSEILLNAYQADYLFMDARRDMYFLCDKSGDKLVTKEWLMNNISEFQNKKIVSDKRTFSLFNEAICYEDKDIDLGSIMLMLAEIKYTNSTNKEEFNYMNIKANYIQTPPVF